MIWLLAKLDDYFIHQITEVTNVTVMSTHIGPPRFVGTLASGAIFGALDILSVFVQPTLKDAVDDPNGLIWYVNCLGHHSPLSFLIASAWAS